jgi:hypothetical protein
MISKMRFSTWHKVPKLLQIDFKLPICPSGSDMVDFDLITAVAMHTWLPTNNVEVVLLVQAQLNASMLKLQERNWPTLHLYRIKASMKQEIQNSTARL